MNNCPKVERLIKEYRCIRVHEIAEVSEIPKSTVYGTLF